MKQTKEWQILLNTDFSKLKSSIDLKYGLKKLYISTLASQFYCEKKIEYDIEYEIEHGKTESTEIQKKGTKIHDAVIPVEPITKEELIEKIETESELTTIFPVFFQYKEVIITGIHDGLYFKDNKAKFLFEIKTTTNSKYLNKVWPGESFQAILYALALEHMGMNIDDLIIVIPKISQEFEKETLIDQIILYLESNNTKFKNKFDKKYQNIIFIHKFKLTQLRKGKALRELRKLLKYWKMERDAEITNNKNKCLSCMHKDICNS